LLDLYAKRAIAKASAFEEENEEERELALSFPYEETHDQETAIEEVLKDLAREKPMDRLICGDVGFGKTEVAVRAAFRIARNNRQVALLCPTTILAQQHFDTFNERLQNF
jgi:transcription-repair coupling factor (superfamily II helicase)